MAFDIRPCEPTDFDMNLCNVIFDAFNERAPLINAMHPSNMTKEGREKAVQFVKVLGKNPSQRWIKATEQKSAKLVGVAQYAVFQDLKGSQLPVMGIKGPEGNWASPEDAAWAQALYGDLVGKRNEVLSQEPGAIICLLKTCVLPDFQRRGVGSLLVQWGLSLADAMNAEMTVEATPEGKPLYERHGFLSHGLKELEAGEQFSARPKQRLYFMHRMGSTPSEKVEEPM